MVIRQTAIRDAPAIARLAGEFDYPATADDIRRRLEALAPESLSNRHTVLVAELDGEVHGWIEVLIQTIVVSDAQAEIVGLVVDERHRGTGVGSMLLEHAEQWAWERGVRRVRVRSNVMRERTHGFYLERGFSESKRQVVFRKEL